MFPSSLFLRAFHSPLLNVPDPSQVPCVSWHHTHLQEEAGQQNSSCRSSRLPSTFCLCPGVVAGERSWKQEAGRPEEVGALFISIWADKYQCRARSVPYSENALFTTSRSDLSCNLL